ncbi:kinase-like domain-containing protein [Durotheca rogersii]|uniref:kinase-like domain-containing protein n=1 Tax=Durotheca rogersii TaxID=419775 RepID=UPI00221F389D|nr:kinase-like domain-containing protein [Durotheca rogersii]KAI5867704.1 kinase-like domain-containing protein [Durotheca rogersii]
MGDEMSEKGSTGALGSDRRNSDSHNNTTLRLQGAPFGLEELHDYELGGHHPVHLGDMLHQRYRVVHKLGSGGYAIVWLCRDMSSAPGYSYVAAKIISAEGSTPACPELRVTKLTELTKESGAARGLLCLPLDRFDIEGPNGTHYVFVYPVLGPRVSRLIHLGSSGDPGAVLRRISSQTTEAMALLHSIGICHGDFRPANILVQISGLDGLSEEEVLDILGEPKLNNVVTLSGDAYNLSTGPRYLVYPVNWNAVVASPRGSALIVEKASLIDFGESFDVSTPTPDLGIPQVYCSPEYVLDGVVGVESDLWALGCTLFEIRTGRKLFDTFDDDRDEYLSKVAMVLGKFPEPWWSETWETRKQYFRDDTDANGRVIEVYGGLGPGIECREARDGDLSRRAGDPVVYQRPEPRSLEEAIREGLYYEYSDRPGGIERPLSESESVLFADLLAKLL